MVRALRILAVLAALATIVIMGLVGDFSESQKTVIFLVFAVVVNLPYILGWFLAGNLRNHRVGLTLFAIVFAGAVAFALSLYWYTFFAERQTDAQDALIFVVVPVYQAVGIIAAVLIAKVVAWLRG